MTRLAPATAPDNWIVKVFGYLLVFVAATRKLIYFEGYASFRPAAWLLVLFSLLYLTQPILSRRLRWYRHLYFLVQAILIQKLGWLRPFEDPWVILYIALGLQIVREYSPRTAAILNISIAAIFTLTLVQQFDWLMGLAYSLTYIAVGLIFLSYEALVMQAENARLKSQKLLAELQGAHRKLENYTLQAEALAAAQERERLTRELHDTVGQMIFSLTLTAEATRILLEKDPARVPEQLDRLQELTGTALSRARSLISEWRPV